MSKQEDRDAWTKHVTKQQMAKSIAGAKRSKYGAVKTDAGGKRYDSAKEAKRGLELAMLQAAKKISGLKTQPAFALMVKPRDGGLEIYCGEYRADFEYFDIDAGERVIEDVKSKATMTPLFRLKKKLVEALYGIRIRET